MIHLFWHSTFILCFKHISRSHRRLIYSLFAPSVFNELCCVRYTAEIIHCIYVCICYYAGRARYSYRYSRIISRSNAPETPWRKSTFSKLILFPLDDVSGNARAPFFNATRRKTITIILFDYTRPITRAICHARFKGINFQTAWIGNNINQAGGWGNCVILTFQVSSVTDEDVSKHDFLFYTALATKWQ